MMNLLSRCRLMKVTISVILRTQIRNCARLEQYRAEQSTLISASDEVTVEMDLYAICGDDTYGAM